MARMSKDELIALIEQAFADTVYPEGAKITDCSWQNCDECREIAEAFAGKHWTAVIHARFLREHYAALSLFQPTAFRFYLPAFMLVTLKSRADLWMIPENLEYHLTPPETEGPFAEDWFSKFGETKLDYWTHRMSGFTAEQKQAIKAFLKYRFPRNWSKPTQSQIHQQQQAIDFWDTFEG